MGLLDVEVFIRKYLHFADSDHLTINKLPHALARMYVHVAVFLTSCIRKEIEKVALASSLEEVPRLSAVRNINRVRMMNPS
jgi:hypothetical protein